MKPIPRSADFLHDLDQKTRKLLYPFLKLSRRTGNGLKDKIGIDTVHLFLLSPPLCGSTVIMQLLRTSPNVTVFPRDGEGQKLPELKNVMLDNRWNPQKNIDWAEVKPVFHRYWSPLRSIRFEKSPPNIIRAGDIEREFQNCHFLITIRNPYAQIEGLLRRGWVDLEKGQPLLPLPANAARSSAARWVQHAQTQLKNLEVLSNTCFLTYEELTDKSGETVRKILDFLPDLESLDYQSKFTAHNVTGKPIIGLRNLNHEKIDKLSREQIRQINSILENNLELLSRFSYSLLPSN